MFRLLAWLFIYILLLGAASFDVKYSDGLHIKLNGWWFK